MDDFYLFGPAAPTFNAFDRFSSSLESRQTGLVLNLQKSVALIPSGDRKIAELCKSRKLSYTSKLLPCLGAAVSRSRKELSRWLKQTSPKLHQSLFTLLLDPSLPSQYSYLILRLSMLPRMNYFSRIFAPDVFSLALRTLINVFLRHFRRN